MLAFGVLVAFGQTEVDDVNNVFGALVRSNQEVVRLDITMNDPFLVNFLDSLNHLSCNMADRL